MGRDQVVDDRGLFDGERVPCPAHGDMLGVRGAGHSLAVEQPAIVNELIAAHIAAT